MQNITIINELIKQARPGTQDLYSKIPFFLRTRLDAVIREQPWTKVSEGCQQNDQTSLDCAKRLYRQVLQAVDEYISACTKKPGIDNCILMMMDRNRIMNEFHDDAAAFVREMDNCLQREKELIFTYQEMEQMEPELAVHNEAVSYQSEEANITFIERLTQELSSQLLQAKRWSEEISQYFNVSQEVASLTQGVISESSSDFAEENIRHYSAELDNLDLNHEQATLQFVTCKQAIVTGMGRLSILCSHYADKLTEDLATWKIAEKNRSVKVGPETNTGALLNMAKRFGAAVNTILEWFNNGDIQCICDSQLSQGADQVELFMEVGRIQLEFQRILGSLIQIVVTVQPKGVISIENKGKKDSPNYCTKKTQPFSSTVRVLAGESFPSFHVLSKDVELVAEKDLAQESKTAVVGKDGGRCLKVETVCGNTLPEIQFNIEVKNFCRVEQNNVYKQFFRLVYKVKVSVLGTEYLLQTMSLPFTFNTGANQILEHMGARMWYCAFVRDLYNSNFQCPDPLSVDEVIDILDNRIAYIGSKTRRLTAQEKTFLRRRLPVASDGTVTMQGFLKDKMKTLRDEEPLNYSFYTWFYSVLHSIESLLLNAWQDKIIYGFCSEKTAEEILMDRGVPEGGFLLRPSVSEIKKTSSDQATAALVMEVKLRKATAHLFDGHSSEYEVVSVPLFYKHIEKNTLYGAIKGIEYNQKPVAKFLYGKEGGGKTLDVLKGYVKKQKEKHFPEYRMLMEKIEKINIRHCAKPTAASAEEVSDGENESGRETNRRKRRFRKSSSNTQNQSNSQSPSMSLGASNSPNGSSATLPVFSSLSSPEVKQETPTHIQFQSGGSVNEQCQRSGTQGKTIAGTTDEEAVNGNAGQQENNLLGNEAVFGDIRMDISNIAHLASSHRSPIDQDCYPANLLGTASMDGTNSLPTQFQYNPQQGNGINNNCFMDSAGSHGYNHGFDNSDKSSLDTDFSNRNLSPAGAISNFSESLPSPAGNAHLSPPRASMQLTVNLPTVLNDAKEVKKRGRKQGGSKGNSQNSTGKKSTTSSRSTFKPVVHIPHGDHSPSSSVQISHANLQNQNNTVYMVAESYVDPDIRNSLNQCTTINLDNLDPAQLVDCILQQRASMQLSPDSGVGDQSPSPESIWKSSPFSNAFQAGSNMQGTNGLSHFFLHDSNILDIADLSHL